MKDRLKYTLTILITLVIGVVGTIFTLDYCGAFEKQIVEKMVSNISLSESDTISSSIDKVYDSVIYIESYKKNSAVGSGSGFIYKTDDKKGYILTNYHVIEGATKVEVTNIKGTTVEATILGGDEYSDVAVLSIDKSSVLQVAELGDSTNSKLGDTIFTVGSPLGKTYMGTVTKGILSGKERTVTVNSSSNGEYLMEVIQIDAALNPGNSGGPLVNINGEVIGINSSKLVQDEIEGMGFAIPIEVVKTMTDKLEKGEVIERPMLGVSLLDINSKYALYKNGITVDPSIEQGIVVVEVQKDAPAEKAGLKKGDVILSINDEEITSIAYFKALLYRYSVGDTIKIKCFRDNDIKTIEVKLYATLANS